MALLFGKKKNSEQEASHTEMRQERLLLLTNNTDFYMREAYNMLRTNVTFSIVGEEQENCRAIVVTSALQSEGKSTTAANLAISYAQNAKKVLLIDCDLRRPKQNRLMNVVSDFGLIDYLVSNDPYQKAVRSTNVIGLDLICSGAIPPNPSELLGSNRMARFVKQARADYDYIILDAPPVNMVTDAVILSAVSDGVIFVVAAGRSERGPVSHAVEQLQYAHAKILGFVLQGVDLEKTHYGYGGYRYRKYGYRYGYKSGYGYGYGYGYGAKNTRNAQAKADEEKKSSDEEKKPSEEEKKSSGERRRSSGEERRSSGEERRSSGEERRSSGEERRPSGEERRTSGEGRRSSGEERRSSDEERRSSGEGKKLFGREKHSYTGKRVANAQRSESRRSERSESPRSEAGRAGAEAPASVRIPDEPESELPDELMLDGDALYAEAALYVEAEHFDEPEEEQENDAQ